MNTQEVFEQAVADGIRQGVIDKFKSSYSSPLEKFITDCISNHSAKFRKMIDDAISSCMDDAPFQETMKSEIRKALAKTLIQRFGGELEKQVNALKSDPLTRARIVMALEEIVNKNTTA